MLGAPGRPGFRTVTPYLMVADVEPVMAFLCAAFAAEEAHRGTSGGGGTHLEVRLGDSMVMVGGPAEPQPASLFLYVEDVDAVYRSALEAGATPLMEPGEHFGEERGAGVRDPFGNDWYLGRHKTTT